jgi:hypothetical protein
MNARRLGRLGMLAVGLSFGAAMASTGTASADTGIATPFSWFAGVDPLSAATTSPFDLDISVNGMTLLDLGSGATATSGMGDIAIAFGDGSRATAEGGFGDYALATADATAIAGDPASGATGNNFDFASAAGPGSFSEAGNDPTYGYSDANGSSFDYASASSGSSTPLTGAFAYAGFNGNGDSASSYGQGASSDAGFNGNGDTASALGPAVSADAGYGSSADPANYDSASVLGTETTRGTAAFATAGSNDHAFVIDPLGNVGSTANAGEAFGNNFDLAGVFGDDLHAFATTGSNMVDILPSLFGDTAAATDIGNFLTDVLSGFTF